LEPRVKGIEKIHPRKMEKGEKKEEVPYGNPMEWVHTQVRRENTAAGKKQNGRVKLGDADPA